MEGWSLSVTRLILGGAILLGGWLFRVLLVWLLDRGMFLRKFLPEQLQLKKFFFPSFLLAVYSLIALTALPLFQLSDRSEGMLSHLLQISLIIGTCWFLMRGAILMREILFERFSIAVEDNLSQRRIRTQVQYVVRISVMVLILLGAAAILLTFPGARKFGASLIASAGLASIVIGFAAQKSLGNFVAGFQLAFTQPLRIDDVVIVEKEWGKVEEINLTYVVVKLWDLRRLIVPITYFVEKPFENWTRTSSELIGTVEISVDFSVPVEEVRAEFRRILEKSTLWNRRACVLQVTAASEKTITLRALMSAADASRLFDLRCEVREALVRYLRDQFPTALPALRISGSDEGAENLPSKLASHFANRSHGPA